MMTAIDKQVFAPQVQQGNNGFNWSAVIEGPKLRQEEPAAKFVSR